jgi:flagellar biogenesis protein FliO
VDNHAFLRVKAGDMDIQKARDWADLLLKAVSIIAILAGGVWAYFQFDLTRTAVDNVQINVSTEQQKYGQKSRLLLIHVRPKNIGKVLVSPGKAGIVVSVRAIPDNLKNGIVECPRFTN